MNARELAQLLGLHPPSEEQQQIIEAELHPAVVIAGAGSGKTSVLAQRVVWLIVNRHIKPERILGLTFTNKAVGELTERIRKYLQALHRSGHIKLPESIDRHATPMISTYNSYASSLVSQYGLVLGLESTGRLLNTAEALELAMNVARRADIANIPARYDLITTAERVCQLANQIQEHMRTPEDVSNYVERTLALLFKNSILAKTADAMENNKKLHGREDRGRIVREVALPMLSTVGIFRKHFVMFCQRRALIRQLGGS